MRYASKKKIAEIKMKRTTIKCNTPKTEEILFFSSSFGFIFIRTRSMRNAQPLTEREECNCYHLFMQWHLVFSNKHTNLRPCVFP